MVPELQIDEAAAVEKVRIVRTQAKRLVAVCKRLRELARRGAGIAPRIPRPGIPGVDLNGVVEILDGARDIPLQAVDLATIVVGRRKSRIVLEGGVEIRDRPVVLALAAIRVAAIAEGRRKTRQELDRAVEIGDCAVIIARVAVGNATIVEIDRKGRRRFASRTDQGGAAGDARLPVVALTESPAIVARRRALRRRRDEKNRQR